MRSVGLQPTRYLQEILQVVDSIYAAACGEAAWDRALAEVSRVGRLDGCALSAIDRLERRRHVLASYGRSAAADPTQAGPPSDRILRAPSGTVWPDRRILSAAPAPASCNERMQCDSSAPCAGVIVGRDERQVVCLEAYAGPGRPSGGPEPDAFLRQLAPHLTRAWRLGGTARAMPPMSSDASSRARRYDGTAPAPALAGSPEVVRLRVEFGLTKAEARLAWRLAGGASLAGAAEAFDVKLTTIRSQLQQVFAKTGTSRQAELVALLLSRGHGARSPLWSPLGGNRQGAAIEELGPELAESTTDLARGQAQNADDI
jgi:DNA-binding CsgD family transcriptional regulator